MGQMQRKKKKMTAHHCVHVTKYLLLIFYINEAQMSLLNERKTADILGIITARCCRLYPAGYLLVAVFRRRLQDF